MPEFLPLLLTGFVLGFAGSLHCVAMCGGFLALALNPGKNLQHDRYLVAVLSRFGLLTLGRITSYALAGAIVGGIGWGLLQAVQWQNGHWILRILTAMLLGTIGAMQLGLIPAGLGAGAARLVMPVSARLNDALSRLPGAGPAAQLVTGLAWGWLPCGLVYGGLTHAMLAGSFTGGGIAMAGFGIGTIPALLALALAAGLAGQRLQMVLRHPVTRRIAGLLLITIAILSVIEHPANPFCQPLQVE